MRDNDKSSGMGRFALARGLGMLFIIIGHSAADYLRVHPAEVAQEAEGLFAHAWMVFGAGVMAMYFMISGYYYFQRSPRKCLKIQTKLLLYPYAMVAASVIVSKFILSLIKHRPFAQFGGEMVMTYLLGLNGFGGAVIRGFEIDAVSILWFVLALFWAWILYNGIQQYRNFVIRASLVIICVLVGWASTLISRIWVYAFPMGLISVGYICAGRWIREYHFLDGKIPAWLLLSSAILSVICLAVGNVNIAECIWDKGLLDIAGSFALGFLILVIFARLEPRLPGGRLRELIEAGGFYSMWILCLHAYEKAVFPWHKVAAIWPYGIVSYSVVVLLVRCLMIAVMFMILRPVFGYLRRMGRRG